MRSRRGLGVLAVCGLVLGMMAISASGAQAGMWMINKANVSTEQKVEAEVALEGGSATLLSTSGGNKVAITCTTTAKTVGTVTLETITGTVNFSGCTTKINGVAEPNCDPLNQPIAAGGTIKAVLHEFKDENGTVLKLPYAKAEGTGGVFATFKFKEEEPKACVALSPSIKVTGTGWLKDAAFETEAVTKLVQEATVPAEALGGLFFGGNKASIDGSANVKFIDAAHLGQTFSGLAE
jgi:hypothetical protein